MPRPVPLSQDAIDAVLTHLRQGHGRNATARLSGVSAGAVSKIAASAGIEFADATRTAFATACGRADAEVDRHRRERELLAKQEVAITARRPGEAAKIERALHDLHRHVRAVSSSL